MHKYNCTVFIWLSAIHLVICVLLICFSKIGRTTYTQCTLLLQKNFLKYVELIDMDKYTYTTKRRLELLETQKNIL